MITFKEFNINKLAEKAEINISKYDMNQLKMGFDVEKEHDKGKTDVCPDDVCVLKIAIAHLNEDPKYYDKLKKVEGEH